MPVEVWETVTKISMKYGFLFWIKSESPSPKAIFLLKFALPEDSWLYWIKDSYWSCCHFCMNNLSKQRSRNLCPSFFLFLVWRDSGVSASRAEFPVSPSIHVGFTPRLLYSSTHHSSESFIHLKTGWAQDAWLQWSHRNWYFHLGISCWLVSLFTGIVPKQFSNPAKSRITTSVHLKKGPKRGSDSYLFLLPFKRVLTRLDF